MRRATQRGPSMSADCPRRMHHAATYRFAARAGLGRCDTRDICDTGLRFSAMGACDTCDNCDTGRAAGACVAVVAEVAGGCPAISASLARASNHIARPPHDAPSFRPSRPAHHGSRFQPHKPSVLFEDAQRRPSLRAFAQRVRPKPHHIAHHDFRFRPAFQQPFPQSFGPVDFSRYGAALASREASER